MMHPIARRTAVVVATILAGLPQPQRALAQTAAVPNPESVFGFPVGADGRLFDYGQSIAYFRRLAAESPNVRLVDVGRTSFGRSWTAVVISSAENLARLDEYRQANQ